MSPEDLINVCHARSREANILHQNGHYHAAIYLLSYAVECVMKALICKRTGNFPGIHDFLILRETCKIPASSFGSQWQIEFLHRDRTWVEMRYKVDQFTDWDQQRKERYYQSGGKLIAFFKSQMV